MLDALVDASERPPGEDPTTWFQSTPGLVADCITGPNTRRALIREYMTRDGTSLPADVEAIVYGCGEAFPLSATGPELDVAPRDGADDPLDRRVELFYFGAPGVLPEPTDETSAGSTEYLSWRLRAHETYQKVLGPKALEVVLKDSQGIAFGGQRCLVHLASGATLERIVGADGTPRTQRLPDEPCYVESPDVRTIVERKDYHPLAEPALNQEIPVRRRSNAQGDALT